MLNRLIGFVCLCVVASLSFGEPFTYQGELSSGGSPADGMFEMEFTLRLTSDSSLIAGPIVQVVDVSGGLFSADLEFGDGVFEGGARSLQIKVRPDGDPGMFTELLPWVEIHSAPVSQYSLATRGIYVSPINEVGVGTTSPGARLDVVETEAKRIGLRAAIDHAESEEPAFFAQSSGIGPVATLLTSNPMNEEATLGVLSHGAGKAGLFRLFNSTNIEPALYAETRGLGNAGSFRINNAGNTTAALFASTGGGGSAGEFENNNLSPTVLATNSGFGVGGEFAVTNSITASPAVWGRSDGLGAAGVFQIMNQSSSASALVAQSSGTGPAGTFLGDLQVSDVIYQGYGTGLYIPAAPVAFGTFDFNGTMLSGSPNLSAVWMNIPTPRCELTITGEIYTVPNYTAVVTPVGGGPYPIMASVSSSNGKLTVTFHRLEIIEFQEPSLEIIATAFNVLIYRGN